MLEKVYVEITTDCNLDCRMCIRHAWHDAGGSMDGRTFEELIRQLREIPSARVIQFGGFGEPTVHPQCAEFILAAKEAGLQAELITNGTELTLERLEQIVDLELDRLIVSLDGTSSTGNGVFHGQVAGRVKENLRNLYRLRILRQVSRPEVTAVFVATKRNVHELPEMKRLAREVGLSEILVTNLIPHVEELAGDILYEHWTTTKRYHGRSPWAPTVDLPRMDARSPAGETVAALQATGTHLRLLGGDLAAGAMRCRFVNEGCTAIAADGGVSPCLALLHDYDYYYRGRQRRVRACRFGNIRETPLGKIWAGEQYARFRDRVNRFDFSPCIDCSGCELRESNETDCYGNPFPACGECLWAAGLVQCP